MYQSSKQEQIQTENEAQQINNLQVPTASKDSRLVQKNSEACQSSEQKVNIKPIGA